MALKIDEQWIRQRVHLKHDNLDDVKSLSLPGSYHEKISYLGTALHSFTRLKHLDLSRNLVCNLEGIGHLQMLETLNLYLKLISSQISGYWWDFHKYYNNISTLKDLYQLRSLTNLKELDIRLNPVTKNEPDHRLFLIHMLPSLKKLDDRSVRDSERKAALMHFNTDQASEFTDYRFQDDYATNNERFKVPRVELVRNLGPRSALDNDDILLLDAITRKDNYTRPISGSNSKFRDIEDYPRQELANMHIMDEEKHVPSSTHHQKAPRTHATDFNIKSGTYPITTQRHAPLDTCYAPYTTQDTFTPTPQPVHYQQTAKHVSKVPEDLTESDHSQQAGHERFRDERPDMGEEHVLRSCDTDNSSPSGDQEDQSAHSSSTNELRLLHKLVDLVDKYWNGSKSLYNHTKFKELAINLLKSYQTTGEYPERDVTSLKELRQEMLVKEEELKKLFEQLTQQQKECSVIRDQLEMEKEKRQQFEETRQELTTLHERFKQIQEENESMKVKFESQKDAVYERQRQSDEAINNYQALQDENYKLKQRLDQQRENLQQLNELASMLQESHRSLVATNDHLLLELSEEKDRHQSEVNQLHWSYKHLKKSIDWIPNVDKTLHKT